MGLLSFIKDAGEKLFGIGQAKAAQEAVVLYEKFNRQTPGAFDSQLAIAKRVLAGLA